MAPEGETRHRRDGVAAQAAPGVSVEAHHERNEAADPGARRSEDAGRDWRGARTPSTPVCIAAWPTSARLASTRPERTAIVVQALARREERGGDEGRGQGEMHDPGLPESGVGEDGRNRFRIDRRAGVVGHRRRLQREPEAGGRERDQARRDRETPDRSATAPAAARRARRAGDRRSTRRPASPPGNGRSGRARARSPARASPRLHLHALHGVALRRGGARRRRRLRPGTRPPPIRHARN